MFLENNIRGAISSVMGKKFIKSDENVKILYSDANNLYGHPMSEPLPFDEIEFDRNVILEDLLNTADDSDTGYFVEVDLPHPDTIKEKTTNFPFAPVNRKTNTDVFSDYMKKIEPDTFNQTERLICDWSDKKNYLTHFRMVKFYNKHGMIVDKVYDIISFNQRKWLEKYIHLTTQMKKQALNDFENDF